MSMIVELARVTVAEGRESDFEKGVAEAAPLFRRARGCRSMSLHRIEEEPRAYMLVVGWDTLDDHMVHFRNSEDFARWRELVGFCFAAPPKVEHLAAETSFFGG